MGVAKNRPAAIRGRGEAFAANNPGSPPRSSANASPWRSRHAIAIPPARGWCIRNQVLGPGRSIRCEVVVFPRRRSANASPLHRVGRQDGCRTASHGPTPRRRPTPRLRPRSCGRGESAVSSTDGQRPCHPLADPIHHVRHHDPADDLGDRSGPAAAGAWGGGRSRGGRNHVRPCCRDPFGDLYIQPFPVRRRLAGSTG